MFRLQQQQEALLRIKRTPTRTQARLLTEYGPDWSLSFLADLNPSFIWSGFVNFSLFVAAVRLEHWSRSGSTSRFHLDPYPQTINGDPQQCTIFLLSQFHQKYCFIAETILALYLNSGPVKQESTSGSVKMMRIRINNEDQTEQDKRTCALPTLSPINIESLDYINL
jgi:hypothetical protein